MKESFMATKEFEFHEKGADFDGDTGKASQDEFVLEQVLGLTSTSAHALGLNPLTGQVAFPAACMLVLLDPKTGEQKFIESPSLRYISSVNFSEDGKFLAFGEYGFKPYVLVWLNKEHREYNKFVVDNSVGIKAIQFHPKSSFMVILGCNDLTIGVWDFVRGRKLALTKWQTSPLSLTIPKPGAYVVVCGHRKVTLLKIDSVQSNMHETNVFQERKAVLLGRQSEYTFVDITSGRNKHEREVYTVTSCGFLCQIRMGDIIIDKAIKVDTHSYCVRYGADHIFVGCCNGTVKICNPETLCVEAMVSIGQLLGADSLLRLSSKNYADTTAVMVNERDSIVTCIYSDYTVHSWQFSQVGDKMVCSVIAPTSKYSHGDGSYEVCIKEQFEKEKLLRSFLGFRDRIKGSKMHEMPATSDCLGAQHGQYVKNHKSRFQHANAIKFSPDGKEVVCGNEEGEIKVYEAATGVLRRVIEAHSSHVTCIDIMYDDEYKLVCSGGRDRIIFVLDAKTDYSLVQVLCDHSAAITALSLVHNSGILTLVSAAADNVILIRRSIPGSTLKFTITGEIAEATHNKSFNLTSEYIVTGAGHGGIKLWKADPVFCGKPTKTIKCEPKGSATSRAIGIDPSGSFLAVTQCPGQITVYHLQTGQAVGSLTSQIDVTSVRFTNDLRYMISSTSNGCALVWRLPEKMTEFMKCKQEKTYQVELAREIACETYVSCLRLCKQLTYDGVRNHDDRDSSSDGQDLDITPSIESLSLLNLCPEMADSSHGEDTVTSTMSFLSCSTCQDSCSDTAFGYQTSDSNIHLQSSPLHFPAVARKNVQESICTRLGMFKYVSSIEGNGLPEMFTFKSQTRSEPFKYEEDVAPKTGASIDFSKNNGKLGSIKAKMVNLCDELQTMDDAEPYQPTYDKDTKRVYNLTSDNELPCSKNALVDASSKNTTSSASPTKSTRLLSTNSRTSVMTTESSVTKDYSTYGSPVPMTSSEMEYFTNCTSSTLSRCPDLACANNIGSKPETNVFYGISSSTQNTTPNLQDFCLASENVSPSACCTQYSQELNHQSEGHVVANEDIKEPKAFTPYVPALNCTDTESLTRERYDAHKDSDKYAEQQFQNLSNSLSSERQKASDDGSKNVLCNTQESAFDVFDKCISDFVKETSLGEKPREEFKKIEEPTETTEMYKSQPMIIKKDEQENNIRDSEIKLLEPLDIANGIEEKHLFQCKDQLEETFCRKVNSPPRSGVDSSTRVRNKACNDESFTESDVRLNEVNKVDEPFRHSKCLNGHDDAVGSDGCLKVDACEDDSVFNYHSITRDEHGRLRWLGHQTLHESSIVPSNTTVDPQSSSWQRNFSVSPKSNHGSSYCPINSLWNIKCSRCTNKHSTTQSSSEQSMASVDTRDNKSLSSDVSKIPEVIDKTQSSYDQADAIGNAVEEPAIDYQKSMSDACDLLLNPSQFVEKNLHQGSDDYLMKLLSKWHGELKQCLQLSNSQETFYRLYSDLEDTELLELLMLALEGNKSTQLMESLETEKTNPPENLPNSFDNAVPKQQRSNEGRINETLPSLTMRRLQQLLMKSVANENDSGGRLKGDAEDNETLSLQESMQILERALNDRKLMKEPFNNETDCESTWCESADGNTKGDRQKPDHCGSDELNFRKTPARFLQDCSPVRRLYRQEERLQNDRGARREADRNADENAETFLDRKMGLDRPCSPKLMVYNDRLHDAETDSKTSNMKGTPNCSHDGKNTTSNIRNLPSERFKCPASKSPVNKFPNNPNISIRTGLPESPLQPAGSTGLPATSHRPAGSTAHNAKRDNQQCSSDASQSCAGDVTEESMSVPAIKAPQTDPEKEQDAESKVSRNALVEIFQDQDEYLRKLKEVREKFEESIRALSNERKFRRAKTDS
ncbi:uncharacterized protein LOC106061781 isoform X1 [Biomphalaria glabrata]|uniref:Uncharacterized protein LOC106061781 isoform X1 n=1 Tax=Biomphalaria glabrata TaxID=6526 RepID=A0A9U8E7W8_BIOGL|nr:uncharacterized protein LOC106061781 isoform X1 [Biomphalaria glabrata]